jgi:hypothetical protein
MRYMLMPLEQHCDDGLGATGEAFEEAAKALQAAHETTRVSHAHLPINFLYRHAVELFLKSMIVVLHRALAVPYGAEPHDGPGFVPVDDKWRPLHRVHGVAVLWRHALDLLRANAAELGARCRTDWQTIPVGLDEAIRAIDEADGSSTFFRYPDPRRAGADADKSEWKPRSPEEILRHVQEGGDPVKVMLVLDENDAVAQAFQYDDAPLAELSRLLAETAKMLSGAHTGLRVELADGL